MAKEESMHGNDQQNSQQDSQQGQGQINQEEAEKFHNSLRSLAQEWRQRLQDPVLRSLVQTGKVKISPLIAGLLKL